jgi:hypothetical protein
MVNTLAAVLLKGRTTQFLEGLGENNDGDDESLGLDRMGWLKISCCYPFKKERQRHPCKAK